MPKIKDVLKRKPTFTREQLKQFDRELEEAGSFEELMLEKQALRIEDGQTKVVRWYDMEVYRNRFLRGALADVQHKKLDDGVPYGFWRILYEKYLEIVEEKMNK